MIWPDSVSVKYNFDYVLKTKYSVPLVKYWKSVDPIAFNNLQNNVKFEEIVDENSFDSQTFYCKLLYFIVHMNNPLLGKKVALDTFFSSFFESEDNTAELMSSITSIDYSSELRVEVLTENDKDYILYKFFETYCTNSPNKEIKKKLNDKAMGGSVEQTNSFHKFLVMHFNDNISIANDFEISKKSLQELIDSQVGDFVDASLIIEKLTTKEKEVMQDEIISIVDENENDPKEKKKKRKKRINMKRNQRKRNKKKTERKSITRRRN